MNAFWKIQRKKNKAIDRAGSHGMPNPLLPVGVVPCARLDNGIVAQPRCLFSDLEHGSENRITDIRNNQCGDMSTSKAQRACRHRRLISKLMRYPQDSFLRAWRDTPCCLSIQDQRDRRL